VSKGGHHPRHWRGESGQAAIEYGGLLILIAAIFTMLLSLGMAGTVQRAVTCALDKIFQIGPCAAAPAYPVSVATKTVGYDGRVIIVDGGHSYTVTETHLSNGTAQISLVNTGTLGVSARVGAQVELGPLGGAEAQASAGGGVYVNGSTTWTFPSWATADKYWHQISSGNSLGLAVNDALNASVPLAGHFLSGLFDDITGAKGAPTQHSIDGRYLTANAAGGGAQGAASAGAGANVGSLGADIKASVSAQAGLEHINSGELKGDWQGTVHLTLDGDGSLGDALFGPHASGIGSLDGDVTVTFGPDFTPQELEVTASGDGVWEATGEGGQPPEGSAHGGTSPEPGGGEGEGGKSEPLLSVSHEGAGGEGVGSKFVGKLDLSHDPAAQAALEQVLGGNTSQIPVLIADMNAHGTEYTQSYHLKKSSSTYGGEVNAGGGGGAELSDDGSSACYDPPRVRQNGGPWSTTTWNSGQTC
jgi:Flp pilus assembly pilin Flp